LVLGVVNGIKSIITDFTPKGERGVVALQEPKLISDHFSVHMLGMFKL